MTQKIYRDGTDQYIMTRLGGIDPDTGAQSILLGESEGDSLDIENLVIVFSEYKKEGEAITTPTITWDSSAGMWKITIPHGNITQYGSAWLNLSGTAMIPVAIEVETVHEDTYYATDADITAMRAIIDLLTSDPLGAISAGVWAVASRTITGGTITGGVEQVLNAIDYTFNATAKTITLNGAYADTELPQIISIKNVTKGLMVIYDCNDPDTAISYTAPVISWTHNFAYKGVAFANTDELQIIVNKKS